MGNFSGEATFEAAVLYAKIFFPQHYHENGPWRLMVEEIKKLAPRRILDLATGPGEPAMSLATEFPRANVTATDIAPDMIAKTNAFIDRRGLENIYAAVVDAQDLSRYEDNSFDIVTCCYGFMFCPHPEKALAEVHRVLKPSGHLLTTVWVKMKFFPPLDNMMAAVCDPKPPPERGLNPMSMSEPGLVEKYITDSGLNLISTMEKEYPFDFSQFDADATFKLCTLPVNAPLTKLAESEIPDAWDRARKIFDANKADYGEVCDSGGVIMRENTYKLCVAQKTQEA